MSKGDFMDLQTGVDAYAAYLRDCVVKGNHDGVIKAETNLKMMDILLAVEHPETES